MRADGSRARSKERTLLVQPADSSPAVAGALIEIIIISPVLTRVRTFARALAQTRP